MIKKLAPLEPVMRCIVAITGASGIPLARRLLEFLKGRSEVYLIISESGKKVIEHEGDLEEIRSFAKRCYEEDELAADISSGSFKFDGMVIVPCSMKTLAAVANGYEDNLISRAANNCLKQEKKLILVPRETPVNRAHIRNMLLASENGASIVLPVLTFYTDPEKIGDMVDFVVGRVVELLNMEHDLYRRWQGAGAGAGEEREKKGKKG